MSVQTVSVTAPAGPDQPVIIVDGGDQTSGDSPANGGGNWASSPISFVGTLAGGIYHLARETIISAAQHALVLVDRLATDLRSTVAWIGEKAAGLIQQVWSRPASEVRAFVADVGAEAGETLNNVLSPAVSAIGNLTAKLEDTSSVLGNAGKTVLVAPQRVAGAVRDTVQAVPEFVSGTVSTVTGAVGHVTGSVTESLASTTRTVEDLATGVLHSPKDAVALTAAAASALKDNVVNTTKDVLVTTKTLAQGINAQVDTITHTLNDVAPSLVSRIDPKFEAQLATADRLREAGEKLRNVSAGFHDSTTDFAAALPPLSQVKAGGIELPQAGSRDGRLLERLGKSEEIRGGCQNCLLQPIETGISSRLGNADTGIAGVGSRLSSSRLGAIAGGGPAGAGGGGTGNGGGAALGGGSILGGGPVLGGAPGGGGDGPAGAGAGPIGGIVNSVRSDVGRTAKGLLGRR